MSFGGIKITPADRWFSLFIRFRDDFTCKACGRYCLQRKLNNPDLHQMKIECAHVFSRRHKAIRHDESNAFALCFTCHQKYTAHDTEWREFCKKLLGEETFDRLQIKANFPAPHFLRTDEKIITKLYREKVKQIAKKEGKEWLLP